MISEKRKAYYKRWREANREQMREYYRQYNEQNRERIAQKRHEYYEANRERFIARAKARYDARPELVKARAAAWNKANPERRKEIQAASNKRHPETYRKAWHKRRAKLNGAGGDYSQTDIARLYEVQHGRCAGCGKALPNAYEIDHVTPVSKGGANTADNLQLLCKPCNRRKRDMTPEEWAARLGKLFV